MLRLQTLKDPKRQKVNAKKYENSNSSETGYHSLQAP